MQQIVITGCGTDVGKTVVAAILARAWGADYWKPVQCCGDGEPDTQRVARLVPGSTVYPASYTLQGHLSPHHAARLEGIEINTAVLSPPKTSRQLLIETAGGLLVPLTPSKLAIDLYTSWEAHWIVVSRHYVGSINHTLLTLKALQQRGLPILGVIFNGDPNPDTEQAILHFSGVRSLGRISPEPTINFQVIAKYAHQFRNAL